MKRGTPRHPKVFDFVQALGLPVRSRFMAIGYLELLWHFTAEFAPQGDIGKYSDDRIEGALDWTGAKGRLIEALTNSGWCDKSSRYRLVVHDWHDHADSSVKKRLERSCLKFLSVKEEVTSQRPQPSRTPADNGSLPEPMPKPSPEPMPVPAVMPANGASFSRWWDEWAAVRGTANQNYAATAWTSVVTVDLLTDVMLCTRSYLQSGKCNDGHGYNPENFLLEQAKQKFTARWPARAAPAKKGYVDSVAKVMQDRISRGEEPL